MYQSDYVTANFTELMNQASDTAAVYLRRAITEIDKSFGEGFAEKNPNLVGAFMQAAASDLHGATLAKVIGAALQEVSRSIEQVSSAIEK